MFNCVDKRCNSNVGNKLCHLPNWWLPDLHFDCNIFTCDVLHVAYVCTPSQLAFLTLILVLEVLNRSALWCEFTDRGIVDNSCCEFRLNFTQVVITGANQVCVKFIFVEDSENNQKNTVSLSDCFLLTVNSSQIYWSSFIRACHAGVERMTCMFSLNCAVSLNGHS